MDILGIGPLEFLFIVLIALIVLGPHDMVKAARSLGSFLRRLVTSPAWRSFTQAQRDLRNLPTALMREAGLEDIKKTLPELKTQSGLESIEKDLNRIGQDLRKTSQEFQRQTALESRFPPPQAPVAPPPAEEQAPKTPEDPAAGSPS